MLYFPPHLINAPALPCETENTEIISFHVNVHQTRPGKAFDLFCTHLAVTVSTSRLSAMSRMEVFLYQAQGSYAQGKSGIFEGVRENR